jgi:NAD(P)-dependent dehydrogenase (short-subunit alcohol dehydrogenase family)
MARHGVLITGGSTGIGRALVRRFALGGHRVWFTYRSNRAAAEDLVAELAGTQARAFEFDQGDWESHRRLHDQLPDPVDVLINNAAVGSKTVQRYVAGSPEQCDAAFLQVNSVGPLWLARAVLSSMLDRGHGKIVNVASVGGGVATFPDFHIADGMSKAALVYLTKHLAAELTHQPVDVFAVCPGAVRTPMLQASLLDGLADAELDDLVHRLPGRRLISPEEVAELIWWLCREEASLLHGAVLDASLGLGVHPGLLTGPGAAMGHASSTTARSVA